MTTLANPLLFEVQVEDDATPFVLTLAHVLRLGRQDENILTHLCALADGHIVVGVTVIDTPRKATIIFTRDGASVRHGIAPTHTMQVFVEAHTPFTVHTYEPEASDDDVVYAVSSILNPPLRPWRECAEDFWKQVGHECGMPTQLEVVARGEERLILGEAGASRYEIHAHPRELQRLFSGVDSFYDLVTAGKLQVRGTMPQLSVFAGASWKVQHHG